jgi:hypothetical protein
MNEKLVVEYKPFQLHRFKLFSYKHYLIIIFLLCRALTKKILYKAVIDAQESLESQNLQIEFFKPLWNNLKKKEPKPDFI